MVGLRITVFTIIMMLFTSCSSNQISIDEQFYGLNTMLDYYYYHYCDYPSSFNELEKFSNLNLYDSSFIDTANVTIHNLKKNENKIVWQLNDAFPISHLLITINTDTIVFRSNENRFPSLDDFISSYTDCYGEFPSTVSGFIAFRKAALNVTKHMQFWEYDSLTILNLQKCNDLGLLSWSVTEKDFIIKIHNDTIANWSTQNQINGFCYKSLEEAYIFSPRFFDNEGVYAFCDDNLYDAFRQKIRELYYTSSNGLSNSAGLWYFLKYTEEGGLESLCNDVDTTLDNKWNRTLFEFVSTFAEENDFSIILFACPFP